MRLRKVSSMFLLTAMVVLAAGGAQAVNIEMVTVGDPGNVGEASGALDGLGGGVSDGYGPARVCGAVGYTYNIGKYEVTVGQYTEFLNAKAVFAQEQLSDDTYGLYNDNMSNTTNGSGITRSGSGTISVPYSYTVDPAFVNRPVNNVSFWNAARFTNWLGNGQGNGSTETGAYTLNGYGINDGSDGRTIQRNPGATWALPSENEWYKAAYYKGGNTDAGYWDSPTKSDTAPGNDMTDASGNNANHWVNSATYPIDAGKYTTVVGEFENSASPYGTFDQGGNVQEWNESVYSVSNLPDGTPYNSTRTYRGGCFENGYFMAAFASGGSSPGSGDYTMGFRVVNVPEPGTIGLIGFAWRRRTRAA